MQHIRLIVAIFVVVLGCGLGYVLLATPIYRADALIQVEANKPSPLSGVQEIADALGTAASPVSGEIEILKSREVIMKALRATNAEIRISPKRFPIIGDWIARRASGGVPESQPLWGLREYAWGGEALRIEAFNVPDKAYNQTFDLKVTEQGYDILGSDGQVLASGVVGQQAKFQIYGEPASISVADLRARPETVFHVVRASPITAYRAILNKITVEESGKQSNIIRVSYEDHDINFAQQLVNAVASAYLTQNVERRSAEADQSLKFLSQQLPEIKQNVENAENALNAFRTRTNTVSVEKSADSLLDQAVSIERSRLQLELQRDDLRQRYKPDHPMLKAIESQLGAIAQEAVKVNDTVSRLPAAQRDLLRLQRDAEVNNQLYIALLNNVQQLKVAKAGTIGNVRIIDFAVRDTQPVAPNKPIIVVATAIIGLVLGVIAAFAARALRPTVREISEVEKSTGLVSYASVPESHLQEKLDLNTKGRGSNSIQLLAVSYPDDPAVESLRSLRTGLAFALMGARDKNIVITGATAGLGKSFISANLSALIASSGRRTLLIETDMRRPKLGTYFGYGRVSGLSDVLAGTAKFENAVLSPNVGSGILDVLPSGQIPPNPGELLLSNQFLELINSVQHRYDHIIFDSTPLLPVGDTLAVARCASTIFMVVRAERSTVAEVKDAIRKLEAAGASVKGLIFNGVKRNRVGYGYAYRYYYTYGKK
ncbi:polysaccharide biosynthesis tyrosine autokinase [Pigmentiphaga soli]|uniref:Polysaccharide biosynthesis tyrosine autokinase n=1 Tax=Pigmentiphaga soli TaxID=1007095 RepID=A0ABP8H3T3_9BURK